MDIPQQTLDWVYGRRSIELIKKPKNEIIPVCLQIDCTEGYF